jgi:hypothetical protein
MCEQLLVDVDTTESVEVMEGLIAELSANVPLYLNPTMNPARDLTNNLLSSVLVDATHPASSAW